MTKQDQEIIIAEIERWLKETHDSQFSKGERFGYNRAIGFIHTLPTEDFPMPEDTVIFQKGVAEGRRLEREDAEIMKKIQEL